MLAPGARIGSFEVLAPLGSGGMGEVYRARDARLGREVAIKVLPAERIADETRRKRLVQEARAASALNHPHIVTIHEIGSEDGIDFIAMEYVAGQTLDALIPKGGMSLRDTLRVAIPIADAVAAAHAKGIIHRDLKPANVIVADGIVKVLDFGLAKLVFDDSDDSGATLTTASVSAALSRSGSITGTAAYMSPEQATGGKADARSDVFSFGALLYEMVTGRRAFAGQTVSETLTSVVSDEPKPPRELVASIPEAFERLILRCLRKEADRRVQHMLDVKVELQEIADGSNPATAASKRRPRVRRAAAALALLLAAPAAAVWLWRSRAVSLPPATVMPLTALPGDEQSPTLSPDGSQVAFSWNGGNGDDFDIYVQMVGATQSRRLTTDPGRDGNPAWSPDGRQIAFVRATGGSPTGTLHVVSPVAGAERRVTDEDISLGPLSWSPDSKWLATGASAAANEVPTGLGIRLFRVSDGEARTIDPPAGGRMHFAPAFSPEGRRLAYASCATTMCFIDAVDLDVDFAIKGRPRRLTPSVVQPRKLAWSSDGRSVVYDHTRRLWRVWADADVPPSQIEIAGFPARAPAIAIGGSRLAFVRSLENSDIYRFHAGRAPDAVVASGFSDWAPALSPDGTRLAFASFRGSVGGTPEGIWVAAADGSNPMELVPGHGRLQGSPSWSPDGRTIAFDSLEEDGWWHVWTIDASGATPRRLTSNSESEHMENMPAWSHDGRFIYFQYAGPDIGVTIGRAPATGGPAEQVTRTGGGRPQASPDGKTLYYGWRELVALPLDGASERTVMSCVPSFGFAVTAAGVYHLPCGASGPLLLKFWDPSTGRDRVLGALDGPLGFGLTASADGNTILYSKIVGQGNDLMLIENFR